MLSKTEQMKQAASLTEKLVVSIGHSIREHIEISKEDMEILTRDALFDEIFDTVVDGYRIADHMSRNKKKNEEEE